ncbi:MAG: T9SS type A sorting domain-containing protein [Bacteroidales bacterium]|nr:T9SS type A sorting domain-containing protein [Bacteroidales bacterium]
MKKFFFVILFIAAFGMGAHAQVEDATIEADQIRYWIGEGENQAILIVNWCNPEIALAWGYRFDGEDVTVENMMDEIAGADVRFSYEGGGGVINDIFYQDENHTLSLTGSYWMYNLNGVMANFGYSDQLLTSGDVVKWGDDGCAIVDWDNWSYTWTTEIVPVSDPNASTQNEDATISTDQIQYWVGEGQYNAVMIVSWCEPEVAFAWGYRFQTISTTVETMLSDIAAADPRFAYAISGGFLTDITYQDEQYDLSIAPDYIVYNHNGGSAGGVESETISTGDYIKFGGYGCAQMDENWVSTWSTEVLPVAPIETEDTTVIIDTTIFDGIVGTEGCQGIFCEDPAILGWATNCVLERGLQDITVPNLWASFGSESDAVGAATTSTATHVVSLGDAGAAILTFDMPITNGDGYDFAVFENALNDVFLELAFVEVSSDGVNYVRFPAVSNTQAETQVDNAGTLDATDIHNLAGKYRVGWGVPFDLEELADNELIDINNVTHVKVIDVIGSIDPTVASRDCRNHIINDPYPTNFASSGFDLSGVCVLNGWHPGQVGINDYSTPQLSVYPNPCRNVIVVESEDNEVVTLFDVQGRMMLRQTASAPLTTLNVQEFPAGIYFVQCGTKTAKVVKRD